MYQGNNPIALQSREWLTQALLSLMEEMPYSKITVLHICRRADLSRQTFYHFFHEKGDILHERFRRIYQGHFEALSRQERVTIDHILGVFAAVVAEHRAFLDLLIRQKLESVILEELPQCIHLFASRFAPQGEGAVSEYGAAFLTGGIAQMLICWLKQEEPATPEELSLLLRRILEGNYFDLHFA